MSLRGTALIWNFVARILEMQPIQTMRLTFILMIICCGSAQLSAQQKESKKPITLHGAVSLSMGAFRSQNFPGRQPAFFWTLSGNPILTAYGMPMPVNAMISNQTRAINAPFSQLGISPSYKWLKLHAGVRSLSMSPFSIAGHTFLGGAIEINPGAFRFAALGGRFQKAREVDSLGLFQLRPAYKRTGYGFRIGVGKKRNYLDLIYLRAKDDSTSVSVESRNYRNFTPDENLVIGLSSRLAFGKRLSLNLDGGGSLYTEDTRTILVSEIGGAELINLRRAINRFYPARITTRLHFAGEAALRYQSRPFQMGIVYRRVEPEYRSMGAWFFQTDIQQIMVNPGFILKKGKTRVLLNAGWQTDNLLGQKPAQSQRLIGGVSVSFNPHERFGIDVQANNFQFTQENRYLSSDSLRLQQATRYITIAPHWLRRKGDKSHTWNISTNYQQSDDYNPYTRENLRSDFVFGQAQWSLQDQKKNYNIGFGVNGRWNKSNIAAEDQSFGITANTGKTLAQSKLHVQVNMNSGLNLRDGKNVGYTIGGGGRITYKVVKNTKLHLNTYYLSNKVAERKYQFLNTSGGLEFTF